MWVVVRYRMNKFWPFLLKLGYLLQTLLVNLILLSRHLFEKIGLVGVWLRQNFLIEVKTVL